MFKEERLPQVWADEHGWPVAGPLETLSAHAAHEDTGMYPWATSHIDLAAQALLYVRIGRWLLREGDPDIAAEART